MTRHWQEPDWREIDTNLDDATSYTPKHLESVANALLRADAHTETCDCGLVEVDPRAKTATCPVGHTWERSQSRRKGIGGENPILFEDHIQSRRKREIFNVNGVPDPSIECGLYNRSHPDGRKVNSPEARKTHGASYYR